MSYGQVNADVIGTSVANSSLGAGNATLMKNKIINGACVIDQRNAGSATANTINGYTVDRWLVGQSTTGKLIAQQNAGSVTPPAGFTNYLGVTSQSSYSIGAGDLYFLQQNIEGYNIADLGWGTANAKTVTLSFWVRSSLTGTFGGSFYNAANNRYYPYSYTISSANTWEQKSITVAGDTTGTWTTTNGSGIILLFSLGIGTTYSGTAGSWTASQYYAPTGNTSVVGTSGATFYITGVQLEVGSSATGFEYRQYGTELALCQRYYAQLGGVTNVAIATGISTSSTTGNVTVKYPTTMRSAPTFTYISISGTNQSSYNGAVSALNTIYAGVDSASVAYTHSGGATNLQTTILQSNASNGSLNMSAEL